MRILMLSWEYPPKIVGGIARHVEELAWALVERPGLEVHVVTCDYPGAPAEEVMHGVHVYRVAPYDVPGGHNDFIHWVHQLNAAMRDRADALCREWLAPKKAGAGLRAPRRLSAREAVLVHAHEWLTFFSAFELKRAYGLPLVATIHATEQGRSGGLGSEMSRYIDGIEWQLVYEAWRVIVCSNFMKWEVKEALHAPDDKLDVIFNGVRTDKFDFDFPPQEAREFRARFAAAGEKIIVFVGRGVREKGCHILIDALPRVRAAMDRVKLVIAGGGNRQDLIEQAAALGETGNVHFTGFIGDDELFRLLRVADVACYPSLYEPFGIVVLEAMAAGAPVVVSDAGGLTEVIEADVTGTVTWANNPESLAWGLLRTLREPAKARAMARRARERVETVFTWEGIAAQTEAVYRRIWKEYTTAGS